MISGHGIGDPVKHADSDAGSRGLTQGSSANPRPARNRVILWVVGVLGIVLAVGIIVPAFNPARVSGPPSKKDASWVEELLRGAISEAQDGGGALPRDASEFKAMISGSSTDFILQRSVVDCEDVIPGVVLIRLDTPPGDIKALRYERKSEDEYQISPVGSKKSD